MKPDCELIVAAISARIPVSSASDELKVAYALIDSRYEQLVSNGEFSSIAQNKAKVLWLRSYLNDSPLDKI
jgi:hypothetical protein